MSKDTFKLIFVGKVLQLQYFLKNFVIISEKPVAEQYVKLFKTVFIIQMITCNMWKTQMNTASCVK